MNKRILFVLAALALAGTGFYFQAQSAKAAKTKAAQLVQQDVAGTDTTASLSDLKSYVKAHMGASVSYTQQGSYDRATKAATAAATVQTATGQVYADAQRVCSGKADSIVQAHCNEDYIQQHLASLPPTPAPVATPKLADYQHSLRSPFWTPDLAGAVFLGALAAAVLGLFVARGRR